MPLKKEKRKRGSRNSAYFEGKEREILDDRMPKWFKKILRFIFMRKLTVMLNTFLLYLRFNVFREKISCVSCKEDDKRSQ